jgi:hypothetical protein
MALTSSWEPTAADPLLTRLEDGAAAGDPSAPEALISRRPGPESYLKPERIAIDTTFVAIAHDGEWVYEAKILTHAA